MYNNNNIHAKCESRIRNESLSFIIQPRNVRLIDVTSFSKCTR